MGAAESTSRTNGTNQEEEERKQKSNTMVRAAATISTWSPTPKGLFKMNIDGACHPNEVYNNTYGDSVDRGPSGYGGILRDHNGNWF
uniref:Polynucleotidyl transferase, ribonuclease H-like superfamily protein 1 n=1 Tax=Tanacetum cinerariifolium TaxID=118510 RepID=A0A699K7R8_TANCI|nr:polynucleotidyl transferase, ribonuclease H-like superfamily protein 1 [Tanacetum cinerariifolium]